MSSLIVLVYILILLCGTTGLIIDVLKYREKLVERPVIYGGLNRIFHAGNLPAAFISFALVLFLFFYNGESVSALVVLALTAAVSLVVTQVQEYLNLPESNTIKINDALPEYRAVFACMESYNEIQKFHEDIFSNISEQRNAFTNQAENTAATLNRAAANISDYVVLQNKECHGMLEKKKSCETAFVNLRESAERFCTEFSAFEQKLSAANTALEYSLKGENIKDDMVISFRDLLFKSSQETADQIDRIVSAINSLVYKCSQFPALSKPYQNILSVYASRMESAISSFENKNKTMQAVFSAISSSIQSRDDTKNIPHRLLETTGQVDNFEASASKLANEQSKARQETAIKLDPNDDSAYVYRGNAYYEKGEYDLAIVDYTQTIKINPNNDSVYVYRGNAYYEKGKYDLAIADYTQAIKINPNNDSAYHNRGNVYYAKSGHDLAIADYTQAIKINPNNDSAYSNRGNAYYVKGDYDRVIADYTQAIKLDPNNDSAYHNRGNVYYVKKDCDRAIADYTQAIKINPNYAIAYSNRGNAYKLKGDTDKANKDFARYEKLK